MGQRQQIFIRIKNPLKKEEFKKEIFQFGSTEKLRKIVNVIFGDKDTTIVPFHHQWLYGLTSVGMLSKILNLIKNAKGEFNPFSKDCVYAPCSTKGNPHPYGFIELIQQMITLQDNEEVAKITGRFGVEGFTYIGDQTIVDLKAKEIEVNKEYGDPKEDCTAVDNNDGIIIIDAITNKYAYVNIGFGDSTILSFPEFQPIDALSYVKAYYKNEKEVFELTEKLTKDFEVLSLEELNKIFPQNFQ